MYKINEVSKKCGVTVRTLHFYDEIGLLKPSRITPGGYRMYNDESIDTLQEILLFKEFGLPLEDICAVMTHPAYKKSDGGYKLRDLFIIERSRQMKLMNLVNSRLRGEKPSDFSAFDRLEATELVQNFKRDLDKRFFSSPEYPAYAESHIGLSGEQLARLITDCDEFFENFHALNSHGFSPDSSYGAEQAELLFGFLQGRYKDFSKEKLAMFGGLVAKKPELKAISDESRPGTGEYCRRAILAFLLKKN